MSQRALAATLFALALPLGAAIGCAADEPYSDQSACEDWSRISNFVNPCPSVAPQAVAVDAGTCGAEAGEAGDDDAGCPP